MRLARITLGELECGTEGRALGFLLLLLALPETIPMVGLSVSGRLQGVVCVPLDEYAALLADMLSPRPVAGLRHSASSDSGSGSSRVAPLMPSPSAPDSRLSLAT